MRRFRAAAATLLCALAGSAFAFVGVAVDEAGAVMRTTNAGASWERVAALAGARFQAVSLVNATGAVAVGLEGTVFLCAASSASPTLFTTPARAWTRISAPVARHLLDVAFSSSGSHGVIVGQTGTLLVSVDGGLTWSRRQAGTFRDFTRVRFFSSSLAALAVGLVGTVARTSDGGLSWTLSSSGTQTNLYGVAWLSATRVFAFGAASLVLHSTDGGAAFQALPSPVSAGSRALWTGVAVGSRLVLVGERGALVASDDGGLSWTVPSGAPAVPEHLYIARQVANVALVVGSERSVLQSANEGASFSRTAPASMHVEHVTGLDLLASAVFLAPAQVNVTAVKDAQPARFAIPVDNAGGTAPLFVRSVAVAYRQGAVSLATGPLGVPILAAAGPQSFAFEIDTTVFLTGLFEFSVIFTHSGATRTDSVTVNLRVNLPAVEPRTPWVQRYWYVLLIIATALVAIGSVYFAKLYAVHRKRRRLQQRRQAHLSSAARGREEEDESDLEDEEHEEEDGADLDGDAADDPASAHHLVADEQPLADNIIRRAHFDRDGSEAVTRVPEDFPDNEPADAPRLSQS